MDDSFSFVRPSDVFGSSPQVDGRATSPYEQYIPNAKPIDMAFGTSHGVDELLFKYDSSPDSLVSYLDDASFSPIQDEDLLSESRVLDTLRYHMHPFAEELDPIACLPFSLDPFETDLISTYLGEYTENLYGFSPDLRPHPMATVLTYSLQKTAAFHFVLSRAAWYRLSTGNYFPGQEQTDLEVAMIKHKGEAIRLARNLSNRPEEGKEDALLASVVGLGFLDRSVGAEETASVHFKAARQLLKAIGGPLNLRRTLMSRGLIHFECAYRSSTQSYFWDQSDFNSLLREINTFFGQLHKFWTSVAPKQGHSIRTGNMLPSQGACHPFRLQEASVLRDCLSQMPHDRANLTQQDRVELVSQLTCLLILCKVITDLRSEPRAAKEYIDSVHKMVASFQLHGRPSNNILWLLQVNDHSEAHSKRVWATAGWIWLLRHVSSNVQFMVRDWLMLFLSGSPPVRALKLDSFAFSYAS